MTDEKRDTYTEETKDDQQKFENRAEAEVEPAYGRKDDEERKIA